MHALIYSNRNRNESCCLVWYLLRAYYTELVRGEGGQFSQGFTFMESFKFRNENFFKRGHTYTQKDTLAPMRKDIHCNLDFNSRSDHYRSW